MTKLTHDELINLIKWMAVEEEKDGNSRGASTLRVLLAVIKKHENPAKDSIKGCSCKARKTTRKTVRRS